MGLDPLTFDDWSTSRTSCHKIVLPSTHREYHGIFTVYLYLSRDRGHTNSGSAGRAGLTCEGTKSDWLIENLKGVAHEDSLPEQEVSHLIGALG